jgi:hypothetical protein
MAQALGLVSGVDGPPSQRAQVLRPDNRHGSWSEDQHLWRSTRVNLFVIGADDMVATLVASLWLYLATPVVVRRRGEPLRLLPSWRLIGTIVVYDVDTLTREEQRALNEWVCGGKGHRRVISTASQSLLPMVEAGLFDDALYYRLNVVTIDLPQPRP